jgi:hypothetical protein
MGFADGLQNGLEKLRRTILPPDASVRLLAYEPEASVYAELANLTEGFFYAAGDDGGKRRLRVIERGAATATMLGEFTHARFAQSLWKVVAERERPVNAANIWAFDLQLVEE